MGVGSFGLVVPQVTSVNPFDSLNPPSPSLVHLLSINTKEDLKKKRSRTSLTSSFI